MKIQNIHIQNYNCISDLYIDCNDKKSNKPFQWTVLLGENNTCKTSILKAIANLTPVEYRQKTVQVDKKSSIETVEDKKKKEFVPAVYYKQERSFPQNSSIIINFSSDIGHPWHILPGKVSLGRNPSLEHFKIYGYGVSRYPAETKLSETSKDECISLFNHGRNLTNIEEWLMQLDYAAKSDQSIADNKLYRIRELVCGKLFPEIEDFLFESDGIDSYTLFKTEDGEFKYTSLGYGYQSMLSWVIDLCKRMFDRYPESPNPLQENAVVLIDEIDLHLHPMWQRDIIGVISKFFTNTQFIVTTHSPAVIQSMDNVNLYVLRRDGNKNIVADRSDITNFQGWQVEEILRYTMNLEDNVHTNVYQNLLKAFNDALDTNDVEQAKHSYTELEKILHPNNQILRLLKLQLDTLIIDNDD